MDVTKNDYLRKIVIYNANSTYFQMTQNYTVTVNWANNTSVTGGVAGYMADWGQNRFNGTSNNVNIPLW